MQRKVTCRNQSQRNIEFVTLVNYLLQDILSCLVFKTLNLYGDSTTHHPLAKFQIWIKSVWLFCIASSASWPHAKLLGNVPRGRKWSCIQKSSSRTERHEERERYKTWALFRSTRNTFLYPNCENLACIQHWGAVCVVLEERWYFMTFNFSFPRFPLEIIFDFVVVD